MDKLRIAFKSGSHAEVLAMLPGLKLQEITVGESLELFTAAAISFLTLGQRDQFEKHAMIIVRSLLREMQTDESIICVGLLLIHFLAADRIGEFHVTLHLLPPCVLKHRLIQYPVDLERAVMEGNYAKALKASRPAEYEIYVGALNEVVAGKARVVTELATQRKFAEEGNPRADAASSMDTLLGYAHDLQRIV